MATLLVAGVRELVHPGERRALRAAALLLAAAAIALALMRVVPNAVALGFAPAAGPEQVALARSIFWDHVLCFACILAFVGVRVGLVPRS
jgi:hypothetical protein